MTSCQLENNKTIVEVNKKITKVEKKIVKVEKKIVEFVNVNKLKEMVILPMLYPEEFANFKINPPRGVIFYGPPGTGKTLMARILAAELSRGGKKVD